MELKTLDDVLDKLPRLQEIILSINPQIKNQSHSAEFDLLKYGTQLDFLCKRPSRSINDLLLSRASIYDHSRFGIDDSGEIRLYTYHEFLKTQIDYFSSLLDRYGDLFPVNHFIELGAGDGLFSLALLERSNQLKTALLLDRSRQGLELADLVSSHCDLSATSELADLSIPTWSDAISCSSTDSVFFTHQLMFYFSREQQRQICIDIASANHGFVIMCEPSDADYSLSETSLRLLSKAWELGNGYQYCISDILRELSAAGIIEIIEVVPTIPTFNCLLPMSAFIWRSAPTK